uniref:Reverse transcriptase Ty1/copia-type domain-containing protein n=1 Tax=Tanacetum cinerariifolium TaxID=118510 RepID=A0A6L2J4R7_TANCI|nr:hypothetical protein [Tanacetum cinerariifolium]
MHKVFPVPVIEFPLAEEVPTAIEESCHCLKKREATARKIALLSKSRRNRQSISNDSFTKRITFDSHHFLFSYTSRNGSTISHRCQIPILDIGKLKQLQFQIQKYLQHEHYALWEVIEIRDSYEVPASTANTTTTDTTSCETGKKSGRTVTLIAKDMQKKKIDLKARTTLLLSLLDDHQLQFTEGSETLEQTFNRLQVIVGQLYFMDVEIKQDDLNQKFLTSLAPEWLMHTIVWRNRSDLDTMSLDDLYNHLKVYEFEVHKKSEPNSENMAFISLAKHSSGNEDGNTACVPTASTNIDEDDMEEIDIKWNMALLSIRVDKFWKKTWKKISIQGLDVTGFDKLKVECFNYHKMGHFARESRAPRSQDRERRDNYRQGSKAKDQALKALMAIDRVGWDWTQVESRLVEYKEREVKYYEKIRTLEFRTESNNEYIEILKKKLETLKQEKEGVDGKLAGLLTASKDLDNLIESQRADKNKEGLGYSVVPPPPAQIYSSPKNDLSWTGLPRFVDDTVTYYSRASPTMESTSSDDQNRNPSVSETVASPITPKPFIKFVKPKDSQSKSKTNETETPKKPQVKNFPTANRKSPTASRKFPAGSTKCSTADMGMKGEAGTYPTSLIMNHLMEDMCLLVKEDARLLENELSKLDETSGILKKFITEIKNLKDLKVKIIRRNGTLIEAARTMLADAKLPVTFWAEVVNTACYVQNRVLVNKFHNKTPYELFNGRSPAIRFIKPFGCHVMILNTLEKLGKFKAKGDEGYFIGGNTHPTATSTIPSADQVKTLIVESPIPNASSPVPTACFTDSQEPSSETRLISKRVANQEETPSLYNILTLINRFEDILGVTTNLEESNGVKADVSNMETTITASPTPTLGVHRDHPKKPKKISDALQDPSWVEAMQEELLQIKIQKVWTLVDCPKGVRPIGTKWVLKNKKDERGIVIRNKARLVAQGHTHKEGIDYDEVFAPVIRIKAIGLFLAYASFMGFTVYQMDVKYAFLYGTIDEEVYVMQPPRFQDPEYPNRVYKVEKDMYGLHQAPRAWYGTLLKYLLTNGFQRDVRSSNTPMDKENPWRKDVKRIFQYLKGHPKLGLWYLKDSPFDLVAYSDSDFSGATRDRKSTTRGCQFLGRRLIAWQCKKQTIIATSTTKAEYVAAASCCGQVLWIQNQLLDYGDCFEKKLINVDHTHNDENVADLLTKPFDAGRFQYLVFWSTARIETTKEGTKILATVDGILRTITESSLRRNLKLQDEEGISSLPDTKLFENLTLMGYNIFQNQKFTFQKGFNEFSSNIATTFICLANNRTYNFSKMVFDGLVKNVNNKGEGSGTPTEPHHTPSPEAQQPTHSTHPSTTLPPVTTTFIPTVTPSDSTPIRQYTQRARIAQSSALPPDRATIAKSFTLPYDLAPMVTSFAADEGTQEVEINRLKEKVKLLKDREGVDAEGSRDDAPIKGRNINEGEAAAERASDDTEVMANILTSMDVATFLSSGAAEVPTGSRSIPTASPPIVEVPTGSDVVPTTSLVFATTTVVTLYRRRKGEEVMVEYDTLKKQKVQEQIDAQSQQKKPWTKKQNRDYYMDVIRSNLVWKVKDFRGMMFKEIKAKFTSVWKQVEDSIPMGSKEEVEKEVKSPDEVTKEKIKEMMQLFRIKEVYIEAFQVKHPIIDWKVRTEGQRAYWKITRLGGSSASY